MTYKIQRVCPPVTQNPKGASTVDERDRSNARDAPTPDATPRMAKRPHRGEETTPEPEGGAPGARAGREAECRGTLEALNAQFASWVARRAVEHPLTSWRRGCEDYLKHLDSIKVRAR